MNPFTSSLKAVAGIIAPVTKAVEVRGKIRELKARAQCGATLSAAEWETLAVANGASSWKDEFVTIVFTSPIILKIIGAAIGNARLADAAQQLIDTIPAYDNLLMAVVFAAVAIKFNQSRGAAKSVGVGDK